MAILTGPEIRREVGQGNVTIDPWLEENAGPASVDLRLHSDLAVYEQFWSWHQNYGHPPQRRATESRVFGKVLYDERPKPLDMHADNPTHTFAIPDNGVVLYPGILYLGRTVERIQTDLYVPQVVGRSSVGRLGMQVHMTAGFGDPGFDGTITLEIVVAHPLRVYAHERVCQVHFTTTEGEPELYKGRYQGQVDPTASRFHLKEW